VGPGDEHRHGRAFVLEAFTYRLVLQVARVDALQHHGQLLQARALAACAKREERSEEKPPAGEVWLSEQQMSAQEMRLEAAEERPIATRLDSPAKIAFDDLRVAHGFAPTSGRMPSASIIARTFSAVAVVSGMNPFSRFSSSTRRRTAALSANAGLTSRAPSTILSLPPSHILMIPRDRQFCSEPMFSVSTIRSMAPTARC